MGRDHRPGRPALSAPVADGGKEVLALRRKWRDPLPVRPGTAAAPDRGGPGGGHERVERLGGTGRKLPANQAAFLEHEKAKGELKALVPEDAKEAVGHGLRARRSKSGAVSFDVLEMGGGSMQRSSESIGTIAAALAKAQLEIANPEKVADRDHPLAVPARRRPQLPLCLARQRARSGSQKSRPA